MHAEFADQCIVSQHLRRLVGRDGDGLARRQDVEVVGVKYYAYTAPGEHRVPEISDTIVIDPVDIDDRRVLSGFVSDKTAAARADDVNTDGEPAFEQFLADRGARRHDVEADLFVQPAQGGIA